jgi:hypothetical protein
MQIAHATSAFAALAGGEGHVEIEPETLVRSLLRDEDFDI